MKLKSASKALDILLSFRDGPGEQGISEISSRLGIPKATVYRLVDTLRAKGFLFRDPATDKYRLGLTLFELGELAAASVDLRKIAFPIMTELRDRTNESVVLYIRDGFHRICLEMVECRHVLRQFTEVGRRLPLGAGACGKLLLAHMSAEDIEKYLREGFIVRYTDNTITDPSVLRTHLATIRKEGYAISIGERIQGVSSVAAPVLDTNGRVVAALGISGPTVRIHAENLEQYRVLVISAAKEISSLLGFRRDECYEATRRDTLGATGA